MQNNKIYSDLNTEELANRPLSVALSPTGHLYLYSEQQNQEVVSQAIANKISDFFSISEGVGLLRLGLVNFQKPLSASLAFWQQCAQIFIVEACKNSVGQPINTLVMPIDQMAALINQAPFMRGIDYLNLEAIETIWQVLIKALTEELKPFKGNLEAYLATFHAIWNTVGHVCFHLAENKSNQQYPFAFLATYTTRLSKASHAQHLPLGRALEEYSGSSKKAQLLSLLLPVQKAAENSPFLPGVAHLVKHFGTSESPKCTRRRDGYIYAAAIPVRKLQKLQLSSRMTLRRISYSLRDYAATAGLQTSPSPIGSALPVCCESAS